MKKGLLISIGLMLLSQHANAQTYFDVYEFGHVNPSASIAASSIDSIGIIGSSESTRVVCFYKSNQYVNRHFAGGIDSIKVMRPTDKLRITVKGVSFNMVMVSGGTFQMGAPSEKDYNHGISEDELPVHQVTLSDYHIGETEVTQELWLAVMGSNPSAHYWPYNPQNPVEQVSWNDCQTFITKLNQFTGMHFRLPTEAEWEFAARGGNASKGYIYSGSNDIGEVAWYFDNSDYNTHEVGTKSPNELGIFDMSGNVLEWCQDWKGPYSSSAQTNPTGPSSGNARVLRGSSWAGKANRDCRVWDRYTALPDDRCPDFGLRLAL